jgi:hypothetical protein
MRRYNLLLLATPVYTQLSFLSRWPGAPEPHRYMKSARLGFSFILFVLLLCVIAPPSGSAQQKEAPARDQSAAPTGTYAPHQKPIIWDPFSSPLTNSVPLFTLRLETNGTYIAEAPNPPPRFFSEGCRPEIASGTWRWDAQKREFELAPGDDFTFYIKRLPLDPHNPNHLVWGSSFLERRENK